MGKAEQRGGKHVSAMWCGREGSNAITVVCKMIQITEIPVVS